jgi:molybdate transport system substrate-binding protein
LIDVISAGAAQGLIAELSAIEGVEIGGSFGAVGAMRQKLLDGEPCDLVVLTQAQIAELRAAGRVSHSADIGGIATAIAVRADDPAPDVSSADSLRAALLAATAIYFPDPAKATAGIHFMKVLGHLGIPGDRKAKAFPNGAAAMREMAASREAGVIGCTQASEIIATAGARLVAPLPPGLDLQTVYAAGVAAGARHPQAARRFLDALTAERSAELRRRCGFQP